MVLAKVRAFINGGTFSVEKSTSNKDNLIIKADGDSYIAEKLVNADNGLAFDVDDYTEDGITFTGYDGFELTTGTKYHGGYLNSGSKFTFFYKWTEDGETFVYEVIGTKR